MTQELRGFDRIQTVSKPFQACADEVVYEGQLLLDYLSRRHELAEGAALDWGENDVEAMCYWSELESNLEDLPVMLPPFEEAEEVGDHEQVNAELVEFLDLGKTFHAALPFDEAERGFFLKIVSERSPIEVPAFLRLTGHYEGKIVSAGIRRVVRGQDLASRWLAWRYETNEFAGQDTLELARTALGDLIRLCTMPKPKSTTQ